MYIFAVHRTCIKKKKNSACIIIFGFADYSTVCRQQTQTIFTTVDWQLYTMSFVYTQYSGTINLVAFGRKIFGLITEVVAIATTSLECSL